MWTTSLLSPANLLRVGGGAGAAVGLWLAFRWGFTDPITVLLMVAVLAIVASFVLDVMGEGRVRRDAEQFADRFGWTYFPTLSGLLARLKTPPFDIVDSSYSHVVTGHFAGMECYDGVFEWRVRIDDAIFTGKHRVAVVRLADELPRLQLVPEGIAAKLAKALGGRDRDFESAAFNRSWRVIAENPKVAHDMLSPRVLEKLNALGTRAPMVFEGGLAVRIDDEAAGFDSLAERLSGLIAVAKFLPQHTLDDHGTFTNAPGPLPSVTTPGAFTGGYKPELLAADEEFLRTAPSRRARRRGADGGSVAPPPPPR